MERVINSPKLWKYKFICQEVFLPEEQSHLRFFTDKIKKVLKNSTLDVEMLYTEPLQFWFFFDVILKKPQ
jgi:hypothetical protein